MGIEQRENYRVRVKLGDVSREILVSAPTSLPPSSVLNALGTFCKDHNVQNRLLKSETNQKPVFIITTGKKPPEVVGMTIPNGESD